MLSAIPSIFASDPMIGSPVPSIDSGFQSWDSCDLLSNIPPQSPKQNPNDSDSISLEPNRSNHNSFNPKSSLESIMEERKQKRKISNRESARRSRMRKQKKLENLRIRLNRLRSENREAKDRLNFVLYHCNYVKMDNNRLRSEYSMLRQKLSKIREILIYKQLQQQLIMSAWPCNNFIATTSDFAPSLTIS